MPVANLQTSKEFLDSRHVFVLFFFKHPTGKVITTKWIPNGNKTNLSITNGDVANTCNLWDRNYAGEMSLNHVPTVWNRLRYGPSVVGLLAFVIQVEPNYQTHGFGSMWAPRSMLSQMRLNAKPLKVRLIEAKHICAWFWQVSEWPFQPSPKMLLLVFQRKPEVLVFLSHSQAHRVQADVHGIGRCQKALHSGLERVCVG